MAPFCCWTIVERANGGLANVPDGGPPGLAVAPRQLPGIKLDLVARRRPGRRRPLVEVLVVLKLDCETADRADDDPWPLGIMLGDGVAILAHANTCSHASIQGVKIPG